MKYNLFRVVSVPSEMNPIEKTIQMYNGEDLKEITNELKKWIKLEVEAAEAKILEPDLKTKSEIFSTESTIHNGNATIYVHYHINATKGNKTAPWGELNLNEYTNFILDMKRWIKNTYETDDPLIALSNIKKRLNTSLQPQFISDKQYILG